MSYLRRAAVAALSIALLGMTSPAHASNDTSPTRTSPQVVAAVAATNAIANQSSIGIGVIHVRDGNYSHGNYDVVLPRGQWTDLAFGWASTAGWYTGPGYCTQQWRSDSIIGSYVRQLPDLGPGQHFIGSHTSYIVIAYRGTC